MKNNHLNFGIVIAVLILLLFNAVLIILNMNIKFHIRKFEFAGGNDNVALERSTAQIIFNTPLSDNQDSEIKTLVNINPEVNFDINFSGPNLFINIRSNLNSDTTYTLEFNDKIKDIYNNYLDKNYKFEFKTKPAQFFYLEKNYSSVDIIDRSRDFDYEAEDYIYLQNLDGSKTQIFKDPNIVKYTKNKDYIIVVVQNEQKFNNIKIIDRKTSKISDLNFENKKIRQIRINPFGNEFIFTLQDIKIDNGIVIPQGLNTLSSYFIKSKEQVNLGLENLVGDAGEFYYSPDGKSIIIRNLIAGEYLLLDPFNIENNSLVSLGKHLQVGNFNYKGDLVLFTDFDPTAVFTSMPYITIFATSRENSFIKSINNYNIDANFFNNSNKIVYSERYSDLEGSKGIFKINISDLDKTLPNSELSTEELIKKEGVSLEMPKMSLDDRYLAIEEYSSKELLNYNNQRAYEFQTKPSQGKIVIYDLVDKKIISDDTIGVEVMWD